MPDAVSERTTTTPPPTASLSYCHDEQDQLSDLDAASPDGSPTSVAPLSTFSDVQIRVVSPPASFLGSDDIRIQNVESEDVEHTSEQGVHDGGTSPNVIDVDAFAEVHRSRTPSPEEISLSDDHLNESTDSSSEDLQVVHSPLDEELQEAVMALSLRRW